MPKVTTFTDDVMERKSYLDENGHEVLDDVPVAIPLRFQRRDNIHNEVSNLVRAEMSRLAEEQGIETFEDADDFDVGDDYDPRSDYELSDEEMYYDHRTEVEPDGTPPITPTTGTGEQGPVQQEREEPSPDTSGPPGNGTQTAGRDVPRSGGTEKQGSGKKPAK